jgi:hypothetical protein
VPIRKRFGNRSRKRKEDLGRLLQPILRTSPPQEPRLLTPQDVSAELNLTVGTLANWRSQRYRPPWVKVGGGATTPTISEKASVDFPETSNSETLKGTEEDGEITNVQTNPQLGFGESQEKDRSE